jgi:PEP-CTERM motif
MASGNKRGAKETGTMTRRLISKCMPALALAGAILLSLPPRADALLQAAISVDAGPSLLACDNVAAGGACPGGVAAVSDTNNAVGVLRSDPVLDLGGAPGLNAEVAIQTSVKGGLNTLSSSGTVIHNTDSAQHTIQLTIGDTGFLGPTVTVTSTGSGTWVDQTLPIGFGNTGILMQWFNDAADVQGANFAGDTPGIEVHTFQHAPTGTIDGTQSFSTDSGLLPINDPANFSMTLDNELTLGPGIRLESRGQAEAKPQLVVVPAPATLLLLGSALVLLGWRRRGSAA